MNVQRSRELGRSLSECLVRWKVDDEDDQRDSVYAARATAFEIARELMHPELPTNEAGVSAGTLSALEQFILSDCFAPRLYPCEQNVRPSLEAITQEEPEEMEHESVPVGKFEYRDAEQRESPVRVKSTSPEHECVVVRRRLFESLSADVVDDAREENLINSIATATVEFPKCDNCGKVRTPFFPSLVFGECMSPRPRDDEAGPEPDYVPETSSSSDEEELFQKNPGGAQRM